MNSYPSYIIEAKARGECFKYDTTDMGHTQVSELMSNAKFRNELKRWDQPSRFPQPILINAPTGAGKTHFVRNELASFAKEQGRSILFLSNRHALNMQTRDILSQSIDSPAFSSNALSAISRYENLVVGTYQSIDRIISELQRDPVQGQEPIGYIVLDEIHFLASDALFNAQTSNIFSKILHTFPHCQRIYLSATPQEVKDIIAYEEYKLYHQYKPQNDHTALLALSTPTKAVSEYLFQPDYSYIRLHFCDGLTDLVSKIKSSTGKWLIFVSKKSDGEEFAETLKKERIGGDVIYVDADSRNNDPKVSRELRLMIKYEKFKETVLISTSLLDNGINFHDSELEHIVVDSVDPIQVKQMIGRKRHDENKPVNVYIVKHTQGEIQRYLQDARDKVKLLETYRRDPQWFIKDKYLTLTETEHKLFEPVSNQQPYQFRLHVNEYAQYKLECLMNHYEHLDGVLEMEGDGAFEREVAGWFGIKDSNWSIIDDVEVEIRKQVVEAIEKYRLAPAKTDSEELKALDRQLWNLVHPIVGKYRIKHDTESEGKGENIRNIMRALGLPYGIKRKDNVWVIIDIDKPTEMPPNEQSQ